MTINIYNARLSLLILKISNSREKTHTCVRLDKSGRFGPISLHRVVNCKLASVKYLIYLVSGKTHFDD